MSKTVHLIVVGKLKDKNLESIEDNYLKRIKSPELKIHEVKSRAEDKASEGTEVIKKVTELSKDGQAHVVALSEFGQEYDSVEFSQRLFDLVDYKNQLIFIIAGAEGFSNDLLDMVDQKLSLSKMTFPHKLARILFIEQFYRAITIKNNHPYHN
jgi:23S rRNA (pseudouridine1915-N3)-methyltransferase